jgi:hypothetical protein
MEDNVCVVVRFEGVGNLTGRDALIGHESSLLGDKDKEHALLNEVREKLGCDVQPIFMYKKYEEVSGPAHWHIESPSNSPFQT